MEITKEFKLCSEGDIVSATVSEMCRLLNIIPFEYAMQVRLVYLDGTIIPQEIVKLTNDDILASFQNTVWNLTAVSLEASIPNSLAVPHMISDVFKNLMFIGAGADYKCDILEKIKNQASQ